MTAHAEPGELVRALQAVESGRPWIDCRVGRLAVGAVTATRVLTAREREVLGLLAEGLTGAQVAERLVLTTETIRSHVKSAMARLGASTRTHAVALALRRGELDRD